MPSPSAVIWNTVLPALGVALVLGAPLLPAIAIAGVATITITVVLALAPRRGRPRRPASPHFAP